MSNNSSTKHVSWIGCLLGFAILVLLYLLAVKLEEAAYEKSKGEWTTYTSKNSPLKYDPMPIRILITDDQGRVWVGTEWESYVIDSNGNWNTLSTNIEAITTDKSGRIWIASGGVHRVDSNGQWTTFPTNRDWEGIEALAIDSQGQIWVGTFDGLIMFDRNGKETIYTKENSGLVDNAVTALEVDQFDRVWIGTYGYGVSVLDPEGQWVTHQEHTQRPRSEDNEIRTFFIDPQDRVWIGTYHGLKIISPDGTRTSDKGSQWGIIPSSLISVEAFALDPQNRMWIAITGRLVVVDSKKDTFTTYTWDNSGLPGVVNALAIDKHQQLWIGTVKGLSVIDLKQDLPKPVSDRWLAMRKILRAPLMIASFVGGLIFLPVTLEFYGFWYISLWVLFILALIGMRWGAKKSYRKLVNISLGLSIAAILGVGLLWTLAFFIALFLRD